MRRASSALHHPQRLIYIFMKNPLLYLSRCWTYETASALDVDIPNELPYNDYFEYYGPDFKLHISPSNMANQNTPVSGLEMRF